MARIHAFLKLGREQACSDIHLAVGVPPMLRQLGELQPIKYRDLSVEELEDLIREILTEEQQQTFDAGDDIDFAYAHEGIGRFRVNVFRKYNGIGAVLRVIPSEIPNINNLGVPALTAQLRHANQGLILITGATGSGKSTTLASIIDLLNNNRRLNIITLEDPIEYIHKSNLSLVIQREIGTHVESFAEGLRAALREDPDVILVGELRDPETISLAMTAAETGQLVLGTLHTSSAVKTIDRIMDAMPTESKPQASTFLAQHLQQVVCQILVRTADGRTRRAITEVMAQTPAISNLILNGKIHQIPSVIQTGKEKGMHLMDQALFEAVKKKQIDPNDAYVHATNKQLFQRFVTDSELLPAVDLAVG